MTDEIKNLFEKYKMVSSVNTVSLKEMLEEAFALGHKKALDEVGKIIDENKIDAILEMLNLLDEKVTKINNRFDRLAKELGYKA